MTMSWFTLMKLVRFLPWRVLYACHLYVTARALVAIGANEHNMKYLCEDFSTLEASRIFFELHEKK